MSVLLSVGPTTPLSPHVHTSFLSICILLLPCKEVHLYHLSRFCIYASSFWFTSLCMTDSRRSIHVSTSNPVLFLFMAEQYSICWLFLALAWSLLWFLVLPQSLGSSICSFNLEGTKPSCCCWVLCLVPSNSSLCYILSDLKYIEWFCWFDLMWLVYLLTSLVSQAIFSPSVSEFLSWCFVCEGTTLPLFWIIPTYPQ